MFKKLFWENGRPTGFAFFYAAVCVLGAAAGYVEGPYIGADIKRVQAANAAYEEARRMAPAPVPSPPCDIRANVWCGMRYFFIPN